MRIRTWWVAGLLLVLLTVTSQISKPGNLVHTIQKPGDMAQAIQKPGHVAGPLAPTQAAAGYALGG